jgi:hypothetical protein
MNAIKICIFIALVIVLSACASLEFRFPVEGRMGGVGTKGLATASGGGNGMFYIDVPGGGRCSGAYDSLNRDPVLTLRIECDDGRTGQITVTRKPDLINGVAVGTLSDGTRGQFVFGRNISYDAEFPGPDHTAPHRR